MQVQPVYQLDPADARRVIAEHPWARVVTNGGDGLRATYAHFELEPSADSELTVAGHFARADPQCPDIEAGLPVLLIFDGPYGYISASWYRPELTDLPSTMNHVSVHLSGTPEVLEGEERLGVLRRTVERYEAQVGDYRWLMEGGGLEKSEQLAPYTICFRLRAQRIEAKGKLSQKMPLAIRERVIDRLEQDGPYHHPPLAAWMRHLSLPEHD